MSEDLDQEKVDILDGLWPHFPLLPVVQRHSGVHGLIVYVAPNADGDRSVIVYHKNLFLLVPGPLKPQLDEVPTNLYATLDEFLADGWRAD